MQTNIYELRPKKHRVYIYGLFNDSGMCRYVGQTMNPLHRLKGHKALKCGKIKLHGEMEMRVIRHCLAHQSGGIERQIVMAYKRRGQCDLNSTRNGCFANVKQRSGRAVYWLEGNQTFQSMADAGLRFNNSSATIANWCNIGHSFAMERQHENHFCYLDCCCLLDP